MSFRIEHTNQMIFFGWGGSVCQHGYFGQGCASRCKDTCNGCNSTHGFCDSGCLPGWNGESCRKRKFHKSFVIFLILENCITLEWRDSI